MFVALAGPDNTTINDSKSSIYFSATSVGGAFCGYTDSYLSSWLVSTAFPWLYWRMIVFCLQNCLLSKVFWSKARSGQVVRLFVSHAFSIADRNKQNAGQ